jgi:naphtho-gamma-pyrone polyketide synthase
LPITGYLPLEHLLILPFSRVIGSRFREELEVDLQPTAFAEITTISGIKKFFASLEPATFASEESAPSPVSAPAPVSSVPSQPTVSSTASAPSSAPAVEYSAKLGQALAIVAEESGIPEEELKDDDQLTSIGIDSLLCLVILSRFREELELDMQSSFFSEVQSIGELKAFFKSSSSSSSSDESGATSPTTGSPTPMTSSSASEVAEEVVVSKPKKEVKSTSILLQGTMGPKTKTVFMFPDGSGSATSYMNIPRVHPEVAVVAMNCPYMTNPKEMTESFIEITKILLKEVRRRQPHGPYHLGGWSAGGSYAYIATQLLQAEGEEVKSLILIDAPCPVGLGKLPQIFFDYWKTIHAPGGIVQDRPLPSWLMDHFQAVNNTLRGFVAQPMAPGMSPKTYLVWAAKGTDNLAGFTGRHLLTAQENEDLGFLMDDKTDFSTRGWEKLIPNIKIERAMTSNHFTIVRGDGAKIIKDMIKDALLDS